MCYWLHDRDSPAIQLKLPGRAFQRQSDRRYYQQYLDALSQRLEGAKNVSLVLELSDFEFYGDIEAARKDFKFGFGANKQIRRAVFVSDQKWIEWFGRLIGPFTRAEEKHFPSGQIEAAYQWANS